MDLSRNQGGDLSVTLRMWKFHGGVHPPQDKDVSTEKAVRKARLPKHLVLPLHQHIGESAVPIVAVGDKVLKGQMIAQASGYVSAPVHAPSSGKVTEITDHVVPHPSGLSAPCIVIATDGEDRWGVRHPTGNYTKVDPSHLRNLIREAGIVGLGGAGFPAHIKLNPGPHYAVETLILNGVECEPRITCDDMLMRQHAREIITGAQIIRHALKARTCIIAIEDNKPEAYRILSEAIVGETDIAIAYAPTIYPQGSEKQLIKVITGREVPKNGLPVHIGVVMHNVGTAYAVYRAIMLGEPLISRYVTITGGAVARHCNLEALIGTPSVDLLDECGLDFRRLDRLIIGGPMMGYAMHYLNVPVIKTSNCLIAATRAEMPRAPAAQPCIRCGACVDVCPAHLLPQQLYWHARAKDFEKAEEYNLFDCIECGCCAYVCPSAIPLVQYYRYAKTEIWAMEREKEKAESARRRFEFRQQRLEREKAERAAKHQQKKAELKEAKGEE